MLATAGGDKNLECVKLLFNANGIDRNCIDFQGNTLLHIAVIYGNTSILEFLVT
jgi:ankyrin repeat protein